jgi:hypothetical protein
MIHPRTRPLPSAVQWQLRGPAVRKSAGRRCPTCEAMDRVSTSMRPMLLAAPTRPAPVCDPLPAPRRQPARSIAHRPRRLRGTSGPSSELARVMCLEWQRTRQAIDRWRSKIDHLCSVRRALPALETGHLLQSTDDFAIMVLDVQFWPSSERNPSGGAARCENARGTKIPSSGTERELEAARSRGRFEEETWRVRKDGSSSGPM